MTWRDRYQEARFRGIPFFVSVSERSGGKRGELHQYAARDTPFFEELGREAARFPVEAHLVGEDYDEDRDRLIAALQAAGPGTLVHPYHGTENVVALDWRVRESSRDGGMAFFSILFVEAGRNLFPSAAVDRLSRVLSAVSDALDAIVGEFGRIFRVPSSPDFLGQDVERLSRDAAEELRAGLNEAAPVDTEAAAAYRRRLTRFAATAHRKAANATEFGEELSALVADLAGLATPAPAFELMLRLSRFGEELGDLVLTTSTRELQERNRLALLGLVRRSAVAKAAELAGTREFSSYGEAIAFRTEISQAIDAEILAAGAVGDDESFNRLRDVFEAVSRSITDRAGSLARVVQLPVADSLPGLVVAWRMYEDPLRDEEVAARNGSLHPGFLPAGGRLEVLSA